MIPNSLNVNSKAGLQLVIISLCALILGGAVLALLSLQEKSKNRQMNDGLLFTYQDMVFERVGDADTAISLGFEQAIDESNLGDQLTDLNFPEAIKGSTAYRLKDIRSDALLAVQRGNEIRLYRFCYFTDADRRDGDDILNVCGSGTYLKSVEFCALSGEWKKTVDEADPLQKFEQSFRGLHPLEKTETLMDAISQAGAADVLVTMKFGNGLSYDFTIYKELNKAAGFRCVYELPDSLEQLSGAAEG